MRTRRLHLSGCGDGRLLQRPLPSARGPHRRDGMSVRSSRMCRHPTDDVAPIVSFLLRPGTPESRWDNTRQKEKHMSTTGWIILILVILLLFGGFGFARRRR